MQTRALGNALIIALLSIGLTFGALSISLVEFVPETPPTATNAQFPSPAPITATPTFPPTLTPSVGLESPIPSATLTFTNTATQPGSCPIPSGWRQTVIQIGETLDSIAARYRVGKAELSRANCLLSENLVSGTILSVPPVATNTPAICNQGAAGWVKTYIVKTGDTFYSIALNHNTSAGLLKSVNCRASDLVYTGETLWAPNVATRTPYPTSAPGVTVTAQPTDPLTETALPFTVTVAPSDAPTLAIATPIPTITIAPTLTASPTVFP
jgi:LysM repeat protein